MPGYNFGYIWMNYGYFCVFWRIFFGYTGIPLTPLADPERYSNKNVSKEWKEVMYF